MSKQKLTIENEKYTVSLSSDGSVELTIMTATDPKPLILIDIVAFDDLIKKRKAIMN